MHSEVFSHLQVLNSSLNSIPTFLFVFHEDISEKPADFEQPEVRRNRDEVPALPCL